jgi:dihydroceramidase
MTDTILMGDASLSHGSLAQIGFWGPVTSTIDWCETNYTITTYIAEFWNTISNISFILFGIFGVLNAYLQRFELRFAVTFLGVVAIGVGSAMFHGTLQYQ